MHQDSFSRRNGILAGGGLSIVSSVAVLQVGGKQKQRWEVRLNCNRLKTTTETSNKYPSDCDA
jgi:hypothetical protein